MANVTELRVALTVQDFGQALAFYRDTLGLEQIADWSSETGRVVVLEAGRATLELLDDAQAETVDTIEAGRRVSGTVRLALEVADSTDMARRLVAAGLAGVEVTACGDRVIAPALRLASARLATRLGAPAGQQEAARLLLRQVGLLWRRHIIDYVLLRATRP